VRIRSIIEQGKWSNQFIKVHTFPHRAHYKIFSKINFTAFSTELRNEILWMDVVLGELSFERIFGQPGQDTILAIILLLFI
jgi:hypothetical protein